MAYNPAPLERLIEHFAKFNGIGRKGAARLAYQVLTMDASQAMAFADAIRDAHTKVHRCSVCQSFTDALQKGMDYVKTHTPVEIAQIIAPQFAETDQATLTTIVTRYYDQDTWKKDLIFTREAFDLLQNILAEAGELPEKVSYTDLVTTEFSLIAAKK